VEDGERFRVAKIGDPDPVRHCGYARVRDPLHHRRRPRSGKHGGNKTFAQSTGAPTTTGSVFYWNVIAPSWNNRIQRADISITLPGDIPRVQCTVGYGVGAPCRDLTISGNTVKLSAQYLGSRTPVTVRASVDVPTPPRAELPWPYTWDRILGISLTGVLWMAVLTAASGLGAFLWYRTTVEPPPGFPLQYAPPPGFGPVQLEYIRTESVPKNGLTATLFYLAERRLIDLQQINAEKWRIRGLAQRSAWADVDSVSVAVGSALKVMGPGTEFEATKTVKSGQKLNTAKTDMTKAVQKWRSAIALWSSARRNSGCARPTRSRSS